MVERRKTAWRRRPSTPGPSGGTDQADEVAGRVKTLPANPVAAAMLSQNCLDDWRLRGLEAVRRVQTARKTQDHHPMGLARAPNGLSIAEDPP